jgi:hypothetical protein
MWNLYKIHDKKKETYVKFVYTLIQIWEMLKVFAKDHLEHT